MDARLLLRLQPDYVHSQHVPAAGDGLHRLMRLPQRDPPGAADRAGDIGNRRMAAEDVRIV